MIYTASDDPSRDNNPASGSGEGAAKKRRRGANRLSCAECRRLKLRCDRSVPCSSCVKRGCSAICPDGSLTTGQGNRFVLASTQDLHEKIHELCLRVRSLEDGLRASHRGPEPHPLLADELLKIKMPLQRDVPPAHRHPGFNGQNAQNNGGGGGGGGGGRFGGEGGSEEEGEGGEGAEVVDAVGSLSISFSGRTKYYGNAANSWYFLQNENPEEANEVDERVDELRKILPPQILAMTGTFPLPPVVSPGMERAADRLAALYWYLPPAARAAELRDVYYTYAAWMYHPLPMDQFNEEIYLTFYGMSGGVVGGGDGAEDPRVAHRLSIMFMVLAIGSLMDPREAPFNVEAEKFHQLARAALFQSNIVDDPTISAVQALYMMTYYFFLADRHGVASGSRFAIMGLAIKLAQSVHRDCGRFNLPPLETQRRRQLFWELYTYDLWQCFTLGRPPNFSLAHIDCKPPYVGEVPVEHVFEQWKHRFTAECMSVLLDQAFGAKTPKYATVLQLDRKLRAFPVPPVLQIAGFGNSDPRAGAGSAGQDSASLILQRHIVLAIREMSEFEAAVSGKGGGHGVLTWGVYFRRLGLLYLHRSFFARAISDHPKDPLGSPYGTSVIAAYRSAGSLVALMRNLHSQLKKGPNERTWFLWGHVFSCAIVLGSIVTRCPSMSLAPSALLQLDSACELFSRTADLFRAQKVLVQHHAQAPPEGARESDLVPRRQAALARGPACAARRAGLGLGPGLAPGRGRRAVHARRQDAARGEGRDAEPDVVDGLGRVGAGEEPDVAEPGRAAPAEPRRHGAYTPELGRVSAHVWAGRDAAAGGCGRGRGRGRRDGHGRVRPGSAACGGVVVVVWAVWAAVDAARRHGVWAAAAADGEAAAAAAAGGGHQEFPQYFPVFDYGPAGGEFPPMAMVPDTMVEGPPGRRDSGTPENMQTTWQDFVAQLGM
ncbi:hypothetical protein PUNSTDRAFT_54365 [Punctularia strigosozonata HHB-11173 SS5]|uniref:uncharacterized protein n=1 Tax=Punctularia strigosozonata (strain HHB-11173) TaxID=741275 RepID=UPI0004416DBE|nr:uncharacterized protein PUNSTDRAFT_54365 [Punctularia strigosozonata HHB-11173 SS5]EIN06066.1 hypothetical protein PUNSTDRAFT_54365 [Punctularia strigosozonata HHB-11173 SS5]